MPAKAGVKFQSKDPGSGLHQDDTQGQSLHFIDAVASDGLISNQKRTD
jgi:hypothetical protein